MRELRVSGVRVDGLRACVETWLGKGSGRRYTGGEVVVD